MHKVQQTFTVSLSSIWERVETDCSCRWGHSGRMRRMIQGDDSSETAVIQGRRSGSRYTVFVVPSAAVMSLIGFLSRPVGPIRVAPDTPLQIRPDPPESCGPPPERRTIWALSAYQPLYGVSHTPLPMFLHLSIIVVSLIAGLVFTPSSFSEWRQFVRDLCTTF